MGIWEKIGAFLGSAIAGGLEGASAATGVIMRVSAEKLRKLNEPGEWVEGRSKGGCPIRTQRTNAYGGKKTYYDFDKYRGELTEKHKAERAEKERMIKENFSALVSLLTSEWDRTHYLTIDKSGNMEVFGKNPGTRGTFIVTPTGKSQEAAMNAILNAVHTLARPEKH